jgi:hypothetical protein
MSNEVECCFYCANSHTAGIVCSCVCHELAATRPLAGDIQKLREELAALAERWRDYVSSPSGGVSAIHYRSATRTCLEELEALLVAKNCSEPMPRISDGSPTSAAPRSAQEISAEYLYGKIEGKVEILDALIADGTFPEDHVERYKELRDDFGSLLAAHRVEEENENE